MKISFANTEWPPSFWSPHQRRDHFLSPAHPVTPFKKIFTACFCISVVYVRHFLIPSIPLLQMCPLTGRFKGVSPVYPPPPFSRDKAPDCVSTRAWLNQQHQQQLPSVPPTVAILPFKIKPSTTQCPIAISAQGGTHLKKGYGDMQPFRPPFHTLSAVP